MDSMECDVEIVLLIAALNVVDELIELHHCPFIGLCELVVGNAVLIGVKAGTVAEVSENESCSVAYLLVSVRELAQDRL